MSSANSKKALVFFSAGVGDAILLVPLVNELKKQNYQVTGLFTSPYHCESIFESTNLFDAIIIKKNKFSQLLYSLLHLKNFDKVFLNHFSFSRSNIRFATLMGKSTYTNYTAARSLRESIHIINPIINVHDALQNVFLFDKSISLADLNFNFNYKPRKNNSFELPKKYIVVQVSSANNKAPYKNWPFNHWLELFKHLQASLPDTKIVVLGDETETELNDRLKNTGVISLIGKTTLSEVMNIISRSQLYVGLDSGLMHMAVALNKPTFTIWGASNPMLYGYEWMGDKHKIVSLHLSCSPCSAWINPNTSRVTDPLTCPDFKCIRDISVEKVTAELEHFIEII